MPGKILKNNEKLSILKQSILEPGHIVSTVLWEWCWWQFTDVGDLLSMLVTKMAKTVTNIL